MVDFASIRGAVAVLSASAGLFGGQLSGQVSSRAGVRDGHLLG
jgi:hypothetical protein